MMIKSEQQLSAARLKLAALVKAMGEQADAEGAASLAELASDVRQEIIDYTSARSGAVTAFSVKSLDDLGPAVIRARVAVGMSQKDVADRLGVSEQQVSKDEAREYQAAGVAKVAEVLDVLNYDLVGEVKPRSTTVLRQLPESTGFSATPSGIKVRPLASDVYHWGGNPKLGVTNSYTVGIGSFTHWDGMFVGSSLAIQK